MTISQTQLKSATSRNSESLSAFNLGYLKAALQDEAHDLVLRIFLEESEKDQAVTRAYVAKKSGKTAPQVTRLLGSAGNWTLETLSSLLGALGYKAELSATKICDMHWSNECNPLVAKSAALQQQRLYQAEGRVDINFHITKADAVTDSRVVTMTINPKKGATSVSNEITIRSLRSE